MTFIAAHSSAGNTLETLFSLVVIPLEIAYESFSVCPKDCTSLGVSAFFSTGIHSSEGRLLERCTPKTDIFLLAVYLWDYIKITNLKFQ